MYRFDCICIGVEDPIVNIMCLSPARTWISIGTCHVLFWSFLVQWFKVKDIFVNIGDIIDFTVRIKFHC